jgi:methylenetetrahydrofolate reductase (NADPH)
VTHFLQREKNRQVKIRTRLNPSKPCFSFEFVFVSVTYGAGGSTRDRTIELVTHIKERTGIEAMAHLTCVGHTKDELASILERLAAARVDNVLALRGDPPKGVANFQPPEGGFSYASELVAFIRDRNLAIPKGTWSPPKRLISNT